MVFFKRPSFGTGRGRPKWQSRLNELSRTEPELVIVASHDEEQHIELTRQ